MLKKADIRKCSLKGKRSFRAASIPEESSPSLQVTVQLLLDVSAPRRRELENGCFTVASASVVLGRLLGGPRLLPPGEENGLRGPGRKKKVKPAEGREGRGTGNYGGDTSSLVSP